MEGEDREISPEEASDLDLYTLEINDDDDDEQYFTSGDMPKLQFRKNISKAKWDDEKGLAEVVENEGGMLRTMGIVRGEKICCTIEESVFLAERGELNLSDANESSIPLKDIYIKIAEGNSGCCWDSFEVYRHLRSLGYIVGRHSIPWTIKSKKDKSVSDNGDLENKVILDERFEEPDLINVLFSNIGISELRPMFDVYPPNSKFKKSCPGDPSFALCIISGEPPLKQKIEDLERRFNSIPLKLCHVEHGRVSFFTFKKVELPLLP